MSRRRAPGRPARAEMSGNDPDPAPGFRFPIFVSEPNDLYAFDSLSDLQLHLEPVDVEDGIYEAYDSEGRRLSLRAMGVRRGWLGSIDQHKASIIVARAEQTPTHAEALRGLLVSFLSAVEKEGPPLDGLSLQELESRALPHARVTVRRSWRR